MHPCLPSANFTCLHAFLVIESQTLSNYGRYARYFVFRRGTLTSVSSFIRRTHMYCPEATAGRRGPLHSARSILVLRRRESPTSMTTVAARAHKLCGAKPILSPGNHSLSIVFPGRSQSSAQYPSTTITSFATEATVAADVLKRSTSQGKAPAGTVVEKCRED
jgi:hypothetical protein